MKTYEILKLTVVKSITITLQYFLPVNSIVFQMSLFNYTD